MGDISVSGYHSVGFELSWHQRVFPWHVFTKPGTCLDDAVTSPGGLTWDVGMMYILNPIV